MDSKRVINNSIALFVMDLSSKILPMVTFPWILRALGPETYGKVGFATAVTGFFGLLAAPGFAAFGVREAARATEPARTLVQKLMGARIMLAFISFALLVVFTFTLAPSDAVTRVLLLLTGTSFLVSAFDVQWLFIGNSRMWRVSSAAIMAQIIYAAIVLTFVHRPGDAWRIPLAVTVSAIASIGLLIRRAKADFDIGMPRFVPEEWSKFLPICATLGVATMMSLIYDQIDTVMLKYMRSEAEVGLYVASYRLMAISMSFLAVLAQVFFPLFSNSVGGDAKKDQRYAQWMANSSIGLALPIATGGFLLAQPICALVMGNRYAGAEHLLRWLMLNLLSGSAAVLFGSRLVPSNRERKYLVSVATGALTNVILNLIFIPRCGAIAAVFTTIAAQSAVAVMAFYFTRDLEHAKFGRPLAISAVASGVMAGVIILANRLTHPHVVFLILGGALVYGYLVFLFHSVWRQGLPKVGTSAARSGGAR